MRLLICLFVSILVHTCLFHLPGSGNANKQDLSMGSIHPLSLFHRVTNITTKAKALPSPSNADTLAPTPAATTATVTTTSESQTTTQYRESIQSALWQINPEYPYSSRQKGEQGIVHLRIKVGASGAVENVEVVESSHSKKLDEAAVKAFLNAKINTAWPTSESKNFPMIFEKNIIFKLK